MDLSAKAVAIVVYNYFELAEFEEPLRALKDAACAVHVVSANGSLSLQSMKQDVDKSDTFLADMLLDDMNIDKYDALVLPGGTVNADNLRTVPKVHELISTYLSADKPVAVICHAPWALISAGVITGRRLTSFPSLKDDIQNAGGKWVDDEVVIDGSLITSRNPDDLPAFCSALIASLQK